MTWSNYRGDGQAHDLSLVPPPPWRRFPRPSLGSLFQPPPGLAGMINAALTLRRPLLVNGPPGSGKSTIIESVAHELRLGDVLRWHITSRSSITEALYRYDVLGRIHEQQLNTDTAADIAPYLQLGPLGTALLPKSQPRALLIDEIDKGDLDLPSDLLDILERGEFEIPELTRFAQPEVAVRLWDSDEEHVIVRGRVQCQEFPFIVMTSNGERDFPPAFLRRCLRFTMPPLGVPEVSRIVQAHLGPDIAQDDRVTHLVGDFVARLETREILALDQLLNAVYIVIGESSNAEAAPDDVVGGLLQELGHA